MSSKSTKLSSSFLASTREISQIIKRLNDPKTHCGNTLAAVTYLQDDLPGKYETRDGHSASVERGNHEASMTIELMVTTRNQYETLTNRVTDIDDDADLSVQLIHEKRLCNKNLTIPTYTQ
jgi:hypothetical protein